MPPPTRRPKLFGDTIVIASCFHPPMTYPRNGQGIEDFLHLARQDGALIIWTHMAFRPGYGSESRDNNIMSYWRDERLFQRHVVDSRRIDDWIMPVNHLDDCVLLICRNNAFVGTHLDLLLRAQKRDHLILLGYGTETMILQTALHASDLNYDVTVIRDACRTQNGNPPPGTVDPLEREVMESILPLSTMVVTLEPMVERVWKVLEGA